MASQVEAPRLITVVVPNPAAGGEMLITPNTLGGWRILNMLWTLTTSAVVAVRNTVLHLDDGSTRYWRGVTAVTQAATTTQDYQATPQATPAVSVSGLVQLALPPDGLWLPRGFHLRTVTALIDVADQYSNIVLRVQELPDGPDVSYEPTMPLSVIPTND